MLPAWWYMVVEQKAPPTGSFLFVGIGQFLLGFATAASGRICLTYVIDSYPKLASKALVLMLVI